MQWLHHCHVKLQLLLEYCRSMKREFGCYDFSATRPQARSPDVGPGQRYCFSLLATCPAFIGNPLQRDAASSCSPFSATLKKGSFISSHLRSVRGIIKLSLGHGSKLHSSLLDKSNVHYNLLMIYYDDMHMRRLSVCMVRTLTSHTQDHRSMIRSG